MRILNGVLGRHVLLLNFVKKSSRSHWFIINGLNNYVTEVLGRVFFTLVSIVAGIVKNFAWYLSLLYHGDANMMRAFDLIGWAERLGANQICFIRFLTFW